MTGTVSRAALLIGMMVVSLSARAAEEAAPKLIAPDEVQVTRDDSAVEFCTALGEVKARSGLGYGAGEVSIEGTLKERAATRGANVVRLHEFSLTFGVMTGRGTAYRCSTEAIAQQEAKRLELERKLNELRAKADEPILCTAGLECEMKWARVTTWLQEHSGWKFRNVTETLITTEGPMATADPAFEVTKVPTGDGKTYRIKLRAFCGASSQTVESVLAVRACEGKVLALRLNFRDELTKPERGGVAQ
jgi:hypothetical protein